MAKPKSQTRYLRIQSILDRAAEGSSAEYDGTEAFWHLPLPDLLRFELGGIRMIAPAPDEEQGGSCCCSSSSEDGDHDTRRSDASGLVLGLRGEPPFDGSRFPRLPWGGRAVPRDEVEFIARWIDDGCPPEDREEDRSLPRDADAPTLDERSFRPDRDPPIRLEDCDPAAEAETSTYTPAEGEIRQRLNIDCMSDEQIDRLRRAFRKLYHLNKWPEDYRSFNNLALIHQNHCQHGWERFLPWHRIYMYEFEQALLDQVPGVTLPYWDWTMLQYHPSRPDTGWRIPKALQCFLTGASLAYLREADPPLAKAQVETLEKGMVEEGKTYATLTAFFADVVELTGDADLAEGEHRKRFVDALLASNSLWYPLRYPGEYQTPDGKPGTIEGVIHYHYPTAEDIEEILSLRTFRDFGGGSLYNDSFGFLDQNPHNTMHIWTGGMNPRYGKAGKAHDSRDFVDEIDRDRNRGVKVAGRRFHTREDFYTEPQYGDMFSNLTAAYDPVFWPVHSNVDRLWDEWQKRHPHRPPADLDAVLTPWSYTIADTLDAARFGYEYVKCSWVEPIGLDAPVGRWVSKKVKIPTGVKKGGFDKAEVRLHRVPQLLRSCFVRVFLNLPEADASTSLENEQYAGYLAVFGHGPCYGGPGHCDLPPKRPRPFDLRPRSHNAPRNHRIDVTKTARKLIDDGAKSLSVTLVVIGVDYREDHDVLRLEGVSLSFLD